ncbi:MAG: DUF2085 domain-containing protein [Methanobrevibacter sp.]|nr:DUF2085 domain-containing protein [Methanobrevibacter sp.]
MNYSKLLCHRIPERSFFIKNHQFPVCARCTGFYTGLAVFLVYNFFFRINYTPELFVIAVILLIPTTIDGFTQLLGYRKSNNTLRFTTGFIGGIGLIIIMKMAVRMLYLIMGVYL